MILVIPYAQGSSPFRSVCHNCHDGKENTVVRKWRISWQAFVNIILICMIDLPLDMAIFPISLFGRVLTSCISVQNAISFISCVGVCRFSKKMIEFNRMSPHTIEFYTDPFYRSGASITGGVSVALFFFFFHSGKLERSPTWFQTAAAFMQKKIILVIWKGRANESFNHTEEEEAEKSGNLSARPKSWFQNHKSSDSSTLHLGHFGSFWDDLDASVSLMLGGWITPKQRSSPSSPCLFLVLYRSPTFTEQRHPTSADMTPLVISSQATMYCEPHLRIYSA